MLNIKHILSEIKYIFLHLHFTHRTVQWRWGTTSLFEENGRHEDTNCVVIVKIIFYSVTVFGKGWSRDSGTPILRAMSIELAELARNSSGVSAVIFAPP